MSPCATLNIIFLCLVLVSPLTFFVQDRTSPGFRARPILYKHIILSSSFVWLSRRFLLVSVREPFTLSVRFVPLQGASTKETSLHVFLTYSTPIYVTQMLQYFTITVRVYPLFPFVVLSQETCESFKGSKHKTYKNTTFTSNIAKPRLNKKSSQKTAQIFL